MYLNGPTFDARPDSLSPSLSLSLALRTLFVRQATGAIPMWDLYSRTWKVTPWVIGHKVIDGTRITE